MLLEQLYVVWNRVINCIPFNPLIGFTKPPVLFLILLPIITLTLLYTIKRKPNYYKLICLILLFIGTYIFTYMQQPTQLCNTLACNRGEVTIIYDHGTIVVVDPGVIGQNRSAYSWISYTLLPHIITTTGKTEIDHFIFLQLNKTVLETLSKLAPEKIAKKIYLPEAQKNKQIEELTTACKQYAIGLVQLENDPLSLSLPTTKLKIIPKNSKKSNTNNYSNILVAIRSQEKKQTILPYAWQKNRINKSHIENIQ